MAAGGLAQHLFCAGKPEVERGARGGTAAIGAGGQHDGGNGVAIYFEQSCREHDYSGDAQAEKCGGKCGCGEGWYPAAGFAPETARTPVGPQSDELVAVGDIY